MTKELTESKDAPIDASEEESIEGEVLPPDAELERRIIALAYSRSGPLPPPQELDAYRQIDPDLVSWIVSLADRQMQLIEREQQHRHYEEVADGVTERRLVQRGQLFGLIALILVAVLAFVLVIQGYEKAGIAFIALDALGFGSAFVYGISSRRGALNDAEAAQPPASRGPGAEDVGG